MVRSDRCDDIWNAYFQILTTYFIRNITASAVSKCTVDSSHIELGIAFHFSTPTSEEQAVDKHNCKQHPCVKR